MEEYHNLFCGGCGGNIGDVLYGLMSGKIADLDMLFKTNNETNNGLQEKPTDDDEFVAGETSIWNEPIEICNNNSNYLDFPSKFDLAIGKEAEVSFSFIDSVAPFDRLYFEQYDQRGLNPNFFKLHQGGVGTGMDSKIGESWGIEEKDHIIKWLDNRGMVHHYNNRIFLGLGSGTGGGCLRGFIEDFVSERNTLNSRQLEFPLIVGILPYYAEIDGNLWWANAASTLLRLSENKLPIILFDNDEMKAQELATTNTKQMKNYNTFCEYRVKANSTLQWSDDFDLSDGTDGILYKYAEQEKKSFSNMSRHSNVGVNVEDINKHIAHMCTILYQASFNNVARNSSKIPLDEKDILKICMPYDKHNYSVIGTYRLPIKDNSSGNLKSLVKPKESNNVLLQKLTSQALLTGLSAFCDFRTASSFYWQALVPSNYGFKYTDADMSYEWIKEQMKKYNGKGITTPPQYSVIEISDLPYIQVDILLGGVNIPKVNILYDLYGKNFDIEDSSRKDNPYYTL